MANAWQSTRRKMRVCLFVVGFFPRDDRIDPVVLECCERAHSNGKEKFYFPF